MSFMTDSNATDTQSGSAAALNADAIPSTDISDFQCGYIQILGTFVGTLTFQGSNDNTNFVNVLAVNLTLPSIAPSVSVTSPGIFYLPTPFRFFRFRMTAYTSGSATVTAFFQRVASGDLARRNNSVVGGTDDTVIGNVGDSLNVFDASNAGGINDDIIVGTSAVEGKVGASRLVNRKYVVIEPLDTNMYMGFTSGVTTSNGIPIFKNQILIIPIGENTQIWFIATGASRHIRFGELA